ncbi:MAG TPA: CehA/McbA family metallohydrolase [Polyangia bacterium]|nr:CehA/McbA family metallohydrolase [Polyangia bacterium]
MKRPVIVVAVLAAGCLGPRLDLPHPESGSSLTSDDVTARAGKPARAFVVTNAQELLTGRAADGEIGDYRLENDRIAVIISTPRHRIGFGASGGNIIDAAPIGGADELKQIYGYFGDAFPRQPIYQHIGVSEDRGTAVVHVQGVDSDDPHLAIDTRYALAPGSDAVTITTRVTNGGTTPLSNFALGDAVEWGRAERFVPGRGFDADGRFEVDDGWVEAIGDAAAYAYVVGEGALDGRHGWAWSDFNDVRADLPAGASLDMTRWFVVSAPTDASRYEMIASLRKERWSRLTGRIFKPTSGSPLAGVRVIFDDRDGPVAVTRSTENGYEVLLPPGDYHVRAEAPGRSGPDKLDVTVGEISGAYHDVLMSRRGALGYRVTEHDKPVPAKLTVFGVAPTVDPRLGPAYGSPGGNVVVSASGEGELPLPPGRYRVVASRGPAYTIDEQQVDVPAGDVSHVDFAIERAVDAFGWRCIDPHQHGFPSSDSAVVPADRLAGDLAEGLDAVAMTDHNVVMTGDWQATLQALQPAGTLQILGGDEVTLERMGHFTVVPFSGQPPEIGKRTLGELAQMMRAPERVVTLAHPRAGGRTGYFDNISFDPHAPAAKDQVSGFDALEVFSGKDTAHVESPLRDWLALLDHGIALTAVGGSDSHLIVGQEAGYPRTCIPPDDRGAITADSWVAAVRKRREALVTNGPFVRVSIGGRGMGQTAPAPKGHAKLEVEIEAAPWIDVRRLEVFINGTRRGKPTEIPASNKPLRYKGVTDLLIERDSYVVVVVRGDAPLGVVVPANDAQSPPTPLAITNPIYLDRDGDGKYTPPEPIQPPRSR